MLKMFCILLEPAGQEGETQHLQCSFCRLGTLCHSRRRNPARRCGSVNQSGVELEIPQSLMGEKKKKFLDIKIAVLTFGINYLNHCTKMVYHRLFHSRPSPGHSARVRWAERTMKPAAAEGTTWPHCGPPCTQGEHTRLKDTCTS